MNTDIEDLIRMQIAFGAGSTKAYEVFNKINNGEFINPKLLNKVDEVHPQYVFQVRSICNKNNIEIIPITAEWYPASLRQLTNPPLILYAKGRIPNFNLLPSVSIVGPRKVSEFGEKSAYALGRRLAKAGLIVVSGGALGCDTAAHKGALSVKGSTVAVMGCGLNYNYLPQNNPLREEIIKYGCLISEYLPNEPTSKYSFPVRNRIISGLSKAVILPEAPYKSGALITAKYAVEQGKDVFVIPGNPTLECYKGSNELLRDGAMPLLNAGDVLSVYLSQYSEYLDLNNAFDDDVETQKENNDKKTNISLSNEAEMLYNNIVKEKFSADDFESLGISDDEILSALTELEMLSLIKSLPGGLYKRV